MADRLMISCYRGVAPVSFPAAWAAGFDPQRCFAAGDGEAYIRFPAVGKAFGVSVMDTPDGPRARVRELPAEEAGAIKWGAFCPPWESYETAKTFGHGQVTRLDELE